MSPSTTSERTHSYAAHLTVAQRKEANELRKTMKPLMEKRRRARINESLSKLKSLIVPMTGKDNSRYSKFEKADILEMTVRFLKELPSSSIKSPFDSYNEGYKECLQRVSTLLSKTDLLDKDTRQRVNDYIQKSVSTSVALPCRNCNGHKSWPFVQMKPKTPNSTISEPMKVLTKPSNEESRPCAPRPIPRDNSNMWRPW